MRSQCFQMLLLLCTISEVLPTIRPGAQWSLSGDQYEGLQWLDKAQSKPIKSEVDTAIVSCLQTDSLSKLQIADDKFQITVSTNTATQKLQSLIDLLKQKGLLQ